MKEPQNVKLTNRQVVVNGHDISNMVTQVQLTLRADSWPLLRLDIDPYLVEYQGRVEVSQSNHDGIARLRARQEAARLRIKASYFEQKIHKIAASDSTLARILLEEDYDS